MTVCSIEHIYLGKCMNGFLWVASVERMSVVILKDGWYPWYQALASRSDESFCKGRKLHHKVPLSSNCLWSYDQIMKIREGNE